MLCSMAINNLVALCHPPPYGRRAAPSKMDGGALEGKTNDYAVPAQGQRHRSSAAISAVPTPCGDEAIRRRHASCCAPCGLPSAAPSNKCTDNDQTGDPDTTLEAAPRRIQGTP
jgi:hypothetical protein